MGLVERVTAMVIIGYICELNPKCTAQEGTLRSCRGLGGGRLPAGQGVFPAGAARNPKEEQEVRGGEGEEQGRAEKVWREHKSSNGDSA